MAGEHLGVILAPARSRGQHLPRSILYAFKNGAVESTVLLSDGFRLKGHLGIVAKFTLLLDLLVGFRQRKRLEIDIQGLLRFGGIGMLAAESFKQYIDRFNTDDDELYVQHISNPHAWEFLKDNIPLFECPDPVVERTYYFRWWTYRKHIKKTPDGFVITEFLPAVPWAGKHNTINCTASLHINEGRWLRDQRYLDDYATFWFRKGGALRSYTTWLAHAICTHSVVTGDHKLPDMLLDDFVANYRAWEQGWQYPYGDQGPRIGQRENGLFFTLDGCDGGEVSIGGHGFRPLLNSAMFGEATAIASVARRAGRGDLAREFGDKAARIKQLIQTRLWDREAAFFKVLPEDESRLADVRELYGYAPWFFNLPDPGYERGWSQLMDPRGFCAPFGPCFAEQRHPQFVISYEGHECQWNGPSWPMSTSIVLTALANLLNNYDQASATVEDYFRTFLIYAGSHRLVLEDGKEVSWIDENLNPFTGDWIARTRLKSWTDGGWDEGKGGRERGKDYNHSTYCDLVITGLVGLRPREDDVVEINPLIPPERWDYFCLDAVPYHGRILTIIWDCEGNRYGHGAGLQLWVNGRRMAQRNNIGRLCCVLM